MGGSYAFISDSLPSCNKVCLKDNLYNDAHDDANHELHTDD